MDAGSSPPSEKRESIPCRPRTAVSVLSTMRQCVFAAGEAASQAGSLHWAGTSVGEKSLPYEKWIVSPFHKHAGQMRVLVRRGKTTRNGR